MRFEVEPRVTEENVQLKSRAAHVGWRTRRWGNPGYAVGEIRAPTTDP